MQDAYSYMSLKMNVISMDCHLRNRHDVPLSSLFIPGHDPVPFDSHVRVLIIVPVPHFLPHLHSPHSLQNAARE